MACSNRPGPAAYRTYIEQMSGQKITQQEWHDLRKLAELDGRGVSRSRVTPEEALYSAAKLGGQLRLEFGKNPETVNEQDVAFNEMAAKLNATSVTESTTNVVRFLSDRGVKDSLALAREYRRNGESLTPQEQWNVPVSESTTEVTRRVELDGDEIICICGNTTGDSGFYPYTNGIEVEPDESWDGASKFCAACNRVFDFETGEVIAQPDHITLLDDDNAAEKALADSDNWWSQRVAYFESLGMPTSDAQGASDAEEILRRKGQ